MTKLKSHRRHSEEGSALIAALIAATLLLGLGLSLAGLSSVEVAIASNHRAGSQARYGADAVFESVLADLLTVPDWTLVLSGVASSRLTGSQNPPVGPGDPPLSLGQLTTALQAESDAAASFGADSPQWRLFAYGWLAELAPAAATDSDEYLIAWVADDVGELDGDPFTDTNGRLQVMARASSARGLERRINVIVGQTSGRTAAGTPGPRILAWREVR